MFNIIFGRWLDSNRRPLELEATALPNDPPPLPKFFLSSPRQQTHPQGTAYQCSESSVIPLSYSGTLILMDNFHIDSFLNGPSPASFSFIFGLFQTNINTILQQINVKNVHSFCGTGIQTHNLENVCLFP